MSCIVNVALSALLIDIIPIIPLNLLLSIIAILNTCYRFQLKAFQ